MNHKRFASFLLGLICVILYPKVSYAVQQLSIGEVTSVYLNPTLPSGGWLTSAGWSTDVIGLNYFEGGTWGTGLVADGYWSGTATVTCNYYYSYYGADGHIHNGSGNQYWYFTCKGYPVSISPKDLTLDKGQSATVTISISGAKVGKIPPIWESSDKSVATVYEIDDYTASVTAKSPGSCVITCSSFMGEPVECFVTVNSFPPKGVSISPTEAEVVVGNSIKLTAKLTPNGAASKLTWSSENTNIATVKNGTVTGVAPGKTRIQVKTDNGLLAYSNITVLENVPKSITISPAEAEIMVGERINFSYTILPEGVSSQLTWSSENSSIVEAFNSGALGVAPGKTRVKVTTKNGLSAYSTITVIADPRGPVSTSLSGTGSQNSPYLISSAADLRYLSDMVNKGTDYEGKYFKQTADIIINKGHYDSDIFKSQELWIPIGTPDHPFKGSYDGDNHIISGIYITEYENMYDNFSNIGVFGTTTNSTIQNLRIMNCLIDTNKGYVGGLVGYSSGNKDVLIENYHVYDGYIKGEYVGGLIGKGTCNNKVTLKISKCSNSATIKSDFRANGIAGQLASTQSQVINCLNTGTINGVYSASGIIDYTKGSIYNCYNAGSVTTTKSYASGILGSSSPETTGNGIYNCVNYGNLYTESANYDAAAILTKNSVSTSFYLQDNYYIDTYPLAFSSKNVISKNNHGLSSSQMKSQDTVTNLNNSTNGNKSFFSKWILGKDGLPTFDWYPDLLAEMKANIEQIKTDDHQADIDYNKPVEVYNLHGIKIADSVNSLSSGIYILRQGNLAKKIIVGN